MEVSIKKNLSISEIAEVTNLSRESVYMHYYRGHLKAIPSKAKVKFFDEEEVKAFIEKFCPWITIVNS